VWPKSLRDIANDTQWFEIRCQLHQLNKIFCRADDLRRLAAILKDYSEDEQACFKSWLQRLNGIRSKSATFKWDKTFVRQLIASCSKDLMTFDDAHDAAEKQAATDKQARNAAKDSTPEDV
jgi:hypothetical protein